MSLSTYGEGRAHSLRCVDEQDRKRCRTCWLIGIDGMRWRCMM